MAAFPESFELLRMAFSAFFWKDHRLLVRSSLMVNVAGHAMDPLLGMLRFHPGLEKARSYLLVAGHTKSGIHLDRLLRG
jgi:hypothetical protein